MKCSVGLAIFVFVISGFASVHSAPCPSYRGYLPIVNVSHSGDTLQTLPSAIAAWKECDATDACKGFTSSGALKSKTFPMTADSSENGSCLYTKVDSLTGCPTIKGYWMAMDSDVENNTITTYTNVSAAQPACNADPSCLGFNSWGQTKNRTMPLITSRGNCFYTKLSAVCTSLQDSMFEGNYYILPDLISSGGVLSTSEFLVESLLACSDNTACRGVNSPHQSIATAGTLKFSRGTCFYAKRQLNGTTCGPVPRGYKLAIDYDMAGGNMSIPSNISSQFAATACDADTACRGFSRLNGLVVRKSSTSPLVPTRKACFFIKSDNIPCLAFAGYRAEPNANHEGDTISVESSTLNAFTKCESDEACEGFNSAGALKTISRPLTISRGTCLYQKIQVGCMQQYGYYAVQDATVQDNTNLMFTLNTSSATPLLGVRSACNMDVNCKGYTSSISTKKAVTKTAVSSLEYSRRECSYLKAPTGPCLEFPGYSAYVDQDVSEDNTTLNSYGNVTQALAACNTHAGCYSFNSLGQTTTSNISSYHHGVCWYEKTSNGTCTIYDGYETHLNADITDTGAVLYEYGSTGIDMALADCTADSNCLSFNSLGGTRNSSTSSYRYGVCLHVKNTTSSGRRSALGDNK